MVEHVLQPGHQQGRVSAGTFFNEILGVNDSQQVIVKLHAGMVGGRAHDGFLANLGERFGQADFQ